MGCGASNHGGRGTPLRLRPQAPKDAPMAEPAEAIPARAPAAPGLATLLDNWRQILATGNLPAGRRLDAVSRWLLITRACVFSMTLTAGLIGGLLAAGAPAPRWGLFGLALAGLVVALALAGLFVSVFYVAPPLRLKHHGLGEPGVFLVWGPLMIGGTYYVTAGALPAWVWLASVPYAITVTSVLIGKHIDKYEQDRARGIRTLPVLLGRRASLRLNQALMIAFYPVVGALVATRSLGPGVALVALALPRLARVLRAYAAPPPAAPPPGYRIWPLWYVALAFSHNRLAGGLFVLGLVVNAALGR